MSFDRTRRQGAHVDRRRGGMATSTRAEGLVTDVRSPGVLFQAGPFTGTPLSWVLQFE